MRCIRGSVYDVVLDMRENSPTYGQFFGVELSETKRAIDIRTGKFRARISVADRAAAVHYMVSAFYTPDHEGASIMLIPL